MPLFDDRDRDSVARDLVAEDDEVRRLAVERVEALPREEVLPCLLQCLGDASWRVRKAAVARLVAWPDAAHTSALLIDALHDGDNPGRRNAAVDALTQIGREALPALIDAAEDEDADVRKFAVDALAGIGDALAVETLVERLADDDPNVRGSAADALGAVGGDTAQRALRDALADASQPTLVRFSALHALDVLETPIHSSDLAVPLADRTLRPGALALLGRAEDDPQAIDVLEKALASNARSCREAAIRALLGAVGRADPEASEQLVARMRAAAVAEPQMVDGAMERLPEADLPTQLVLVQFLGLAGQPRAVVAIVEAGHDETLEPVSLAALDALGRDAELALDAAWEGLSSASRSVACTFFARVDGTESASRLLEALDDEDVGVRTLAARSIGQRGVQDGAERLAVLLERSAREGELEVEEERLAVGEALVCMARNGEAHVSDTIVASLAPLLEGEESVRLAAATVLGGMVREQDADRMALLLRDASPRVRRVAVAALARCASDRSVDALHTAVTDESPAVRVAAATALGSVAGEGVQEALVHLAEDRDPRVRAAAVRAIAGRLVPDASPADTEAGLAVLRRACEDVAQVALAAVEAVREVGGIAVPRALGLLERPEADVVREAVRCLAIHGDEESLQRVVPLVAHTDWSVRAEAIQTLASRRIHRAIPAILRRLDTEQDEYVRSVTLRALQRLES